MLVELPTRAWDRLAIQFGLAWLVFLSSSPSARADKIDEYVQAEMQRSHLPGLALAVTRGGSVVKVAGYGLANVENEIPVTGTTVFQIQSVTKQFVATAIMMLVEEGKLSLDANVATYLDGAPDLWKEITLRRLLTHTSGIKDFINEPTASLRLEVTEEEVLKATAARPLNFQPGEKYAYSNTNYHLLAMIIRKVTGDSYGAFLKRRIFEPLGMAQSRIVSWTDLVPHRAAGYGWRDNHLCNGEFVAQSILGYGGGGILSTAEDMAKWDLGLRAAKILPQSSLERMWSTTKLNDGTISYYGFGWGVGGERPHRYVQHSGGHITGFTSDIIRFLDDDLSVIVLVNAGFANPNKIGRAIAGLYIPELRPPERKAIEDKEPTVAELLRKVVEMVRAGRLEGDLFTSQMREALKASLSEASAQVKASGAVTAIELLERKNVSDGARQSLYRVRFETVSALVTLVRDKEGRIAGVSYDAE